MAINPFRKGGTDTVPVSEGGTGATVAGPAATPGTALNNLGALDTAAHALLDHSTVLNAGLPGFIVLDNTSTAATLQTALNTYNVVYLKPGTYSYGNNVQIQIPDGKSLIGLAMPNNSDMNFGQTPRFNVGSQGVGGGAYFTLGSGGVGTSALKNIGISGGSGSNSGHAITTNRRCLVENIFIEDWMTSGTTSGSAVQVQNGSIARNVLVRNAKNYGFLTANGAARDLCVLEHCTTWQCDADGFRLSGPSYLVGCHAFNNAGDGFRGQSSCSDQKLHFCTAESNTSDGFDWTSSSGSDGTTIANCSAISNTGFGFNCTAATGGRPALIGNSARANVGGQFNIAGWQNLSNWTPA